MVITGNCSIGTHALRIGLVHLANDFCWSCGDEQKGETGFRTMCTCPALGRRRKKGCLLHREIGWIVMHGYWEPGPLYRKFRVIPGIEWENINLWYHNRPFVQPKCHSSLPIGKEVRKKKVKHTMQTEINVKDVGDVTINHSNSKNLKIFLFWTHWNNASWCLN